MNDQRVPLTRTEKILLLALAVSVLVAVLIPAAFFLSIQEQNRREATDLEERRIEACRAYNIDQTNDRNTAIHGLRQFAIVFLSVSPERADIELASPHGQEFVAYINGENPYRTCTPKCVEAQYDADLADCRPADNQEGKP